MAVSANTQRGRAGACKVCKTIVSVASARFEDTAAAVLGDVSEVLRSECPHVESLPRGVEFPQPLAEYAGRDIMVRKEKHKTNLRFIIARVTDEDENIVHDREVSPPVELVHRPEVPEHAGRGLIPDREWVHWGNVQQWVRQCDRTHGNRCHEPRWLGGFPRAVPEWLVDVRRLCLVHRPTLGNASAYVALSYARGECDYLRASRRSMEFLTQPGALASDACLHRMPDTIWNAIAVTRGLGERYLWVDSLCIIQDDGNAVYKSLAMMNLIYATATVTIVALTGQGLDYGLRGLQTRSQARDLKIGVCELDNGEKLVTNPVDDDEVTSLSYQNRAWTYGEFLFSRRRLIFSADSVQWLCQCAAWKEHLIPHPPSDAVLKARAEASETPSHAIQPTASVWDLAYLTTTFNTRVLSVTTDAAKAFAAVQHMMDGVQPGGMNFGLSEFWFEIQLAWSSLDADMERRVPDRPAYGPLCALPSWSWLGWHGPVTWPVDLDFQIARPWQAHEQRVGFRRPVARFSALPNFAQAAALRPINSDWLQYRDRVEVAEDREFASGSSGWYMEGYEEEAYPYDFNPRWKPRRLFSNRIKRQATYKYPVFKKANFTSIVPSRQDPFITAQMMKVRLPLTEKTVIWSDHNHARRIRIRETIGGPTVLSLTLPNTRLVDVFLDPSTRPASLELIAFAQGWSTWLGDTLNVGTYLLLRGSEAGCSAELWDL